MSLLMVQKYGGTSLGTPKHIHRVATRIKKVVDNGYRVIVVVSAMGHSTDTLLSLAKEVVQNPSDKEMDVLLSTGEQISMSLLAMALIEKGIHARSYTANQLKICTDNNFSNARIKSIDFSILEQALKEYKVCIVAGFQGVDSDGNITTLGRGGSDTSAVALAIAMNVEVCEIYTDVDGVYTADPNKVSTAKKLDSLSYDEMLELSSLGAGVVHNRSVELAKKKGIILHVRSSLSTDNGTLIKKEDKNMEEILVSGVTLKEKQVKVSLLELPDYPGIAAQIFHQLAKKDILVDMIVQSTGVKKKNTIAFTIENTKIKIVEDLLKEIVKRFDGVSYLVEPNISIVSIVGVGMKSHTGIAAQMFDVLAKNKINIDMISTSEIKISCAISFKDGTKALNLIHDLFYIDTE